MAARVRPVLPGRRALALTDDPSMTAITPYVPHSAIAYQFAELAGLFAMRRIDDLVGEDTGEANQAIADELWRALLGLCNGCPGRTAMVLPDAVDVLNDVFLAALAKRDSIETLAAINAALGLLFTLFARSIGPHSVH